MTLESVGSGDGPASTICQCDSKEVIQLLETRFSYVAHVPLSFCVDYMRK